MKKSIYLSILIIVASVFAPNAYAEKKLKIGQVFWLKQPILT